MPFEFSPCLAPFVADTGGPLSLFRHHWDRGEEYCACQKQFDTGLTCLGPISSISSSLEILCGMEEIEHFKIGKAFGERPIDLCTICGDYQLQIRILAP